MQKEDLFLKELQNFIRFLQKWLDKRDFSKEEILEFESEGTFSKYLLILNDDVLDADQLSFLSYQSDIILKELIKVCIETHQIEKSKTIYNIFKVNSKTVDLAFEQKLKNYFNS